MEQKPHIRYEIDGERIKILSYDFFYSTATPGSYISFDQVTAFIENTIPQTLLINENEVIFLPFEHNETLLSALKSYSVPVMSPIDIWENICRVYLDTNTSLHKHEVDKLAEINVSFGKILEAQRKISRLFFITWEWQYLGHWDVLQQKQKNNILYGLFGKKFYWWTMETALLTISPSLK